MAPSCSRSSAGHAAFSKTKSVSRLMLAPAAYAFCEEFSNKFHLRLGGIPLRINAKCPAASSEMDPSPLRLKRFVIANFKSVKRIDLDSLENLALFMGRNNAGKSNILDAFKFLSDAATSFDLALSTRGGELTEVVHRKKKGAS